MELDTLHLSLEIMSAIWLFVIAWLNFKLHATGEYSNIVGVGATVAGVADIMHAVASAWLPELLDFWVPLSWAMTRVTILSAFVLIAASDRFKHYSTPSLVLLYTIPLVTSIAVGFSGMDISFVYEQFVLFGSIMVYRPLDFIIMIAWIIMSVILNPKSKLLFPPHTYWVFMTIGILMHAAMAFGSKVSLDVMFFIAHALKIAEYWTYILLYLWYSSIVERRRAQT